MTASLWLLTAALALTGPDGVQATDGGASAARSRTATSRAPRRSAPAKPAAVARSGETSSAGAVIDDCIVMLKDVVDVAAQESGLLTELNVHEGSEIKEGDSVGQINDSKAQMAKKVAEAEHKVALAEAENDIAVRYSRKAAEVAKQDYGGHLKANIKVPGSTPDTELEKLKLQWQKAELEIEKAQLEQKVAALTAEAKEANVDAAEDDIHRRRVLAPLDGIVAEVFKHAGEWVNPGDRVVQMLRMNRLRVEGSLNVKNLSPAEVVGRPVRVIATTTGGKQEVFEGKVEFVDVRVLEGGDYRVKAEVANREVDGAWTLLPGTLVKMVIESGGTKLTERSRR